MTIRAEIQKLEPSALVEMFVLDATIVGGDILYFHSGVNILNNTIHWQGIEYTRYPVQATGFEWTSKGKLPRPTMRVSNISGVLGAYLKDYEALIGCTVTRKRTLVKYLDGSNFPGGINATADPTAHFNDEIYYIDRKAQENKIYIEFELAASFDVTGVMLPRRQVIQNVCPWAYRGAECGYAGPPVADATDHPTTDPGSDACGKRLKSCELRFGAKKPLPYGGYPGAGLMR